VLFKAECLKAVISIADADSLRDRILSWINLILI